MDLIPIDSHNLPVLENLMQFYLYDFSVYFCGDEDGAVDEAGLFQLGIPLARYRDGRAGEHRYRGWLARVDGQWAGFALIGTRMLEASPGPGWNIDEFFVMRCFRRRGIGRVMARRVFDTARGLWQVMQVIENTPAQAFWRDVIEAYTGGRYEEFTRVNDWDETEVWQRFDSSAWE